MQKTRPQRRLEEEGQAVNGRVENLVVALLMSSGSGQQRRLFVLRIYVHLADPGPHRALTPRPRWIEDEKSRTVGSWG